MAGVVHWLRTPDAAERCPHPTDRLLLVAIAHYEGAGGAWPSLATLADIIGVQRRNARKALGRLQDAGLVTVERGAGGNGSTPPQRRPNRYTLTLPEPPVTADPQDIQRGDARVPPEPPGGDAGVLSGGDAGVPLTSPMNQSYEPVVSVRGRVQEGAPHSDDDDDEGNPPPIPAPVVTEIVRCLTERQTGIRNPARYRAALALTVPHEYAAAYAQAITDWPAESTDPVFLALHTIDVHTERT